MVKNRRPVLRARVVALHVQGGGIVNNEENFQQLTKRNDFGVEADADHLGMAGIAAADVLIGRGRGVPAHVTGFDRMHALQLVEHRLNAPETTARQGGLFKGRGRITIAHCLLPC